ncbi:hypothetical protein EAS68_00665 [Legionella jordanis]|nr:hypothetical protein EAS68_00665 [Legionella jordanis]
MGVNMKFEQVKTKYNCYWDENVVPAYQKLIAKSKPGFFETKSLNKDLLSQYVEAVFLIVNHISAHMHAFKDPQNALQYLKETQEEAITDLQEFADIFQAADMQEIINNAMFSLKSNLNSQQPSPGGAKDSLQQMDEHSDDYPIVNDEEWRQILSKLSIEYPNFNPEEIFTGNSLSLHSSEIEEIDLSYFETHKL